MFYCDKCGKKNGWQETFFKSKGKCEICEQIAICNDMPSKFLPPPRKVHVIKNKEGEKYMTDLQVLNLPLLPDNDLGEGETIKTYLRNLLLEVWRQEESFNGKRPFGNSGWKNDLYAPLVKEGLINGTYVRENGKEFVENADGRAGDIIIESLILHL